MIKKLLGKWLLSLSLLLLTSEFSSAKSPELFDPLTNLSTPYLNTILQTIDYPVHSGHIDDLSLAFQKDFFEKDKEYFDHPGNFSKFLLNKYPTLNALQILDPVLHQEVEEKATKMVTNVLDFIYSSR